MKYSDDSDIVPIEVALEIFNSHCQNLPTKDDLIRDAERALKRIERRLSPGVNYPTYHFEFFNKLPNLDQIEFRMAGNCIALSAVSHMSMTASEARKLAVNMLAWADMVEKKSRD